MLKLVYYTSVFISGGIGDTFAVESFLTDDERENISTIYYATNKQKTIELLFKSLKNYEHIVVWDDFSKFWCFFFKDQCLNTLICNSKKLENIPDDFIRSKDLSISIIFDQVKKGLRQYNQSSFIKNKLTDISKFNLKYNYFVISPYSSDKRVVDRDFNFRDWANCLSYLKKTNTKGVVLNDGNESIPKDNQLIDLSKKTNILEAIEILKQAKGYIGIDSSISVLASKLFNFQYLHIKSKNKHLYDCASCYYAPQTDFSFIKPSIGKIWTL